VGQKEVGRDQQGRGVIQKEWLLFRIDLPEKATDLEGAGGPGDSGGPAFIEENGKVYIAGVSSFTDDANEDKIYGNFGDREAYTRASSFAEWIDKIIAAN
jgi:Trypsin